ncbi:MAG: aminoacyl-tRNA hydrolase [Bacilli bacterium]
MHLIVGLGNIGDKYDNTRHNIGFSILDLFAKEKNLSFNKEKFNGSYIKTNIENKNVILLKPLKYMNLSGEVINNFVNFFKIDLDKILIISDDIDQDLGNYKLKASGGTGGHNGLLSIERNLKTKNYYRLKIGISKNLNIDISNYVLGKFNDVEKDEISKNNEIYMNILNDFTKISFLDLMNKYN